MARMKGVVCEFLGDVRTKKELNPQKSGTRTHLVC